MDLTVIRDQSSVGQEVSGGANEKEEDEATTAPNTVNPTTNVALKFLSLLQWVSCVCEFTAEPRKEPRGIY